MINFINKMERKYGRYAIKNLTVYILMAYAVGYILSLLSPQAYRLLILSPELVMKGQVWRLFTWICTIPDDFSFFIVFMFLFQYFVGTSLERVWGAFKYNLYIFSGIFFMTVSSVVIYLITGISMSPSTYYINMASFLAYALCFPNHQVYFMMIIPIKVIWLAVVDLIYIAYEFIAVGTIKTQTLAYYAAQGIELSEAMSERLMAAINSTILATRVSIIVSLLNFFIFFLITRNMRRYSPKEVKRKFEYKKQTAAPIKQTKHKCAICGKTEKDGDNIVFRYCSKCNGNYEFCDEHLYTHVHF